ncbi:fumarylacetoacetate hydrolase family protein [Rhizobacter sp. Root404]|jgi:fumarylpyruvate hydrolase|uniref:fumarylacetoacetate hydrolase family protein n=1 Tax=Rhizobacter sp. Root404 TaxID=1736528 RepID=UPI0006FEB27A|nr:fumarylacetoacetate hydrolase family protein [Rhizobacter sp. Root404]KQW37008.1 5-carboxymethyl-2-hydroxymuconate isomerase [Rhizobacter sp. Root404]
MTFVINPVPAAAVPVQGGAAGALFPVHRIYCVGRNYVEHAIEMGHSGREAPFFFMKPADAVLPVAEGTVGAMHYPTLTKSLHHELELVVAIGKGGRDIPAAQALEHVWGYAIGLDMTRRDLQNDAKKQGRPWCISKGFDESAPIGPIRRAEDCSLTPDTKISLLVNGQPRQASTLGKLIWSVAEIIEHLSKAWELQPGDLIYTGTPEGVAAVEVGDTLRASLEGVGTLEVKLIPAA